MTNFKQKLISSFPQLNFSFGVDLAPLTYFKIGGPAEVMVKITKRQDLIDLVRFCQSQSIKFTILGGASNVIVSDKGVSGLVIFMALDEVQLLSKDNEQGLVRAEAGVKTALLVSKTIQYGLAGLERFLGVPGTIGGAVYNNAHYLKDLISTYINRVEIIDEDGQVKWLKQVDCDFEYDHSRFHSTREVILQAEFKLPSGDANQSREIVRQATVYRAKTQPLGKPSSGCIFKNVPNNSSLKKRFPQFAERDYVPTGFLIDQAGLKGVAEGDIEVSHKHAAFFVNLGQAKAENVKKLIEIVQTKVEKEYGVKPEPEVFWLE